MKDDDNITNAQFEEVSSAEMTQGNMDTMLTENIPISRDMIENVLNSVDACNQLETEDYFDVSNKILTLAPGKVKCLFMEILFLSI